ncbi:50S ribosomal protein L10 [Candidatus Saccharibacteria bacterium CG10_big_fil_rev_8_21_14_0_10_47_8]|nr:MAG: 50S ribosomal protein L10 [Candidatus Saccharibacteria bacterium CG10_big_fil_rev_8_21_14_0_10_47_8]
MALSKQKKSDIVSEVSDLLARSKLTVIARYKGTPVKAMQQLRKEAYENHTQVMVIKNRLVKKAIEQSPTFKDIDTNILQGQLLYAFSGEDEVAPAQSLANFAKQEPQIEFVGALTAEGQLLAPQDVSALAQLPSKDQLRGILAGTIAAPLSSFVSVASGNIRGVLNVLTARAEAI